MPPSELKSTSNKFLFKNRIFEFITENNWPMQHCMQSRNLHANVLDVHIECLLGNGVQRIQYFAIDLKRHTMRFIIILFMLAVS